ncbi:MAG: N-6 DNA methylase [Phycisphaeraceae bacterium]|nr:N-6 DNA methylase [Phycisphaeraceae bacterium]
MEVQGWTISEASIEELRRQGRWIKGIEFSPEEVGLLALLLYLRWLDHDEAEREAIASFDDAPFERRMPRFLRWEAWRHFRGEKLWEFVQHTVPDGASSGLGRLPRRLDTLFAGTFFAARGSSPAILDRFVDWVGELDFSTRTGNDRASAILELAIDRCTKRRELGQYSTPRRIVDLIVEFADPKAGERIYDPCFGMGGLLVACGRRILQSTKRIRVPEWERVRSDSLFGVEINPLAFLIGATRVALAGIPEAGLELGDALERPTGKSAGAGFDCIVSVPPWGRRSDVLPERTGLPVPSGDLANQFLQHIMASMRPGGRAVVALPEGVLFRSGPDRQVRKRLLTEFDVEGVIGLPEGAFAPLTSIRTSLLLFRRAPSRKTVRFLSVPASRPEVIGEFAALKNEEMVAQFRSGSGADTWDRTVEDLVRHDCELVARRSGDEELTTFLDSVRRELPASRIVSLREVADVRAGVSYQRDRVTDVPGGDPAASRGLIRVADLVEGRIRPPTMFMDLAVTGELDERAVLKPGDIVASISGSVGKIAAVDVHSQGFVASKSIAVIRPHSTIGVGFLAALLASEPYQAWMKGHARGVSIQHLSPRLLAELPIPMVPPAVQQQMAASSRRSLAELVSVVRRPSAVDQQLEQLWEEVRSIDRSSSDPLPVLRRWSELLRHWRNQTVHGERPADQPVREWLLRTSDALRPLADTDRLKSGTSWVALLQAVRSSLDTRDDHLTKWLASTSFQWREIDDRLRSRVREALAAMYGEVRLEFKLQPNPYVVGSPDGVWLLVQNRSSLPVRELEIETSPQAGEVMLPLLAEQAEQAVPLEFALPLVPGPLPLHITWRATALDGKVHEGRTSLVLDVQPNSADTQPRDIGTNPYIVGPIVDRDEMFFGRGPLVDRVRRQVNSPNRQTVILLEGNRRSGKSSVLRRLQSPEMLSDWLVVPCQFQGGEGDPTKPGLPTREVFRLVARDIGLAAMKSGVEVWPQGVAAREPGTSFDLAFKRALDRVIGSDQPFQDFEQYVKQVLVAMKPKRLLLLLDEFDKLQEGIDSGVTSPQVPENLRYLLQSHPEISAVFSYSRLMGRLRRHYWSILFGMGIPMPVGALDPADAARLVEEPVKGRVRFTAGARDMVVSECACQPFLIQSVCSELFDSLAAEGGRLVDEKLARRVLDQVAERSEHFSTLWDAAGTERRRLLIALCESLAQGPDPVTLELLEAKLAEQRIPLPKSDSLGEDLDVLRQLEVVSLNRTTQGSVYRLLVPLMAAWVRNNVDVADQMRRASREAVEKLQ